MPSKNVTKEDCKGARRQAWFEIKMEHELADILALRLFCEQLQRAKLLKLLKLDVLVKKIAQEGEFKGLLFKKVPYIKKKKKQKKKKKIAQEAGEFSIISNLIAKDGINDNFKGLEL